MCSCSRSYCSEDCPCPCHNSRIKEILTTKPPSVETPDIKFIKAVRERFPKMSLKQAVDLAKYIINEVLKEGY